MKKISDFKKLCVKVNKKLFVKGGIIYFQRIRNYVIILYAKNEKGKMP